MDLATMKRPTLACKICGNASSRTIHRAREMMFGTRDTFTYLECPDCRCLQLVDPPADMSTYYPPNYYSLAESPVAMFDNPIKNMLKGLRTRYAATNQGLVGRFLYERTPDTLARSLLPAQVTPTTRILDVGCGSGIFLYALRNAGFAKTMGEDPFIDRNITYPNGLMIAKDSLETLPESWDLIMLHHAFEHVPNPLEVLKTIFGLLAPNGICLIRIPTTSSYAWQHYGADWVQLDAPRHYFLHSVESIRLLSRRVGLVMEQTIFDSYAFQFWGSEQYRRDIPLDDPRSYKVDPTKSIFTPAQIAEYERQSADLNRQQRGDQAAFYLRKPA